MNGQYENQLGSLDRRILSLQSELDATVQKVKLLNSPTAIKCLEEELERLEKAISHAEAQKQALANKKPFSLEDLGRKLKHLYEHLDEVVRQQMDPVKKARIFSLLFDRSPTYADLDLGTTPKSIFTGVNPLFLPQNNLVSSAGTPEDKHFEPPAVAIADFYQSKSTFFDDYEANNPLTCYFCEGVYDA